MVLYIRNGNSVQIEWAPENTTEGREAIYDITDASTETDLPVRVDDETAEQIRDRYKELISDATN
jgi:hypothetical protein